MKCTYSIMDYYSPPEKQRKKKDKAREKKDRFGTKSTKHVRQVEGMLAKNPPKPKKN